MITFNTPFPKNIKAFISLINDSTKIPPLKWNILIIRKKPVVIVIAIKQESKICCCKVSNLKLEMQH